MKIKRVSAKQRVDDILKDINVNNKEQLDLFKKLLVKEFQQAERQGYKRGYMEAERKIKRGTKNEEIFFYD